MLKADYIQICDKNKKTLAYLSPQSDGIRNATVSRRLTEDSTLVFEKPYFNDMKDEVLDSNAELYLYANNTDAEFVILQENTISKEMAENGTIWTTVNAVESQSKLKSVYVTARNDGESWVDLLCYVLSRSPATKIPSSNPYSLGSSGHALYAMLYYADWGNNQVWTLGTVDVDGTYDIETEKTNLYENIMKVQELWGGVIVFDSINHIIHFREQEKWTNYRGYQVRYGKNQKSVKLTTSNNLCTKLYVFGNDNLNIEKVNSGKGYIEDYSYTNIQYTDIAENPDIYNQTQLLQWGKKQLKKRSKPLNTYEATALDLQQKEEFAHEEFTIGDMVDVINEKMNISERLRIVEHSYDIFQPYKSTVNIGYLAPNLAEQIARGLNSYDELLKFWNSKKKINKAALPEETIVTETIITNNLYAQDGNIANLTVNRLSTDFDRAFKWLDKDTNPINYIVIEKEKQRYLTAMTDGKVSIAHTHIESKKPLYWQTSPSTTPRKQLTMSEKVTSFPVMVYQYQEAHAFQFNFEPVQIATGTAMLPVMTWGRGTDAGGVNGRGKIYKFDGGMIMQYTTEKGLVGTIKILEDGKVYVNDIAQSAWYGTNGDYQALAEKNPKWQYFITG